MRRYGALSLKVWRPMGRMPISPSMKIRQQEIAPERLVCKPKNARYGLLTARSRRGEVFFETGNGKVEVRTDNRRSATVIEKR